MIMTSRKFGAFWAPSTFSYTKMAVLLKTLFRVSLKYVPPPPFLRDVIYESSFFLILNNYNALLSWSFQESEKSENDEIILK